MNPLPRVRALAAVIAGLGLAACGHDWSAGPDVPDAAPDVASDDTPAPDGAGDAEATEVPQDETPPHDAEPDIVPADADSDDALLADGEPPCIEPSGHDEDGDGISDGCDNCPTYVNADQTDEDGDGLGDACEEPSRHDLFSHVIGFDPFLAESTLPGLDWVAWNGSWTWGHDMMVGSAVPTGGNYLWVTPIDQPLAVEAEFRLLPDGTGSASIWGCALLGTRPEAPDGTGWLSTCCFGYATRELSIWHWRSGATALERLATYPEAVEPSGSPREMWRRIRFAWDGELLRCRLDTGDGLSASSVVEHVPTTDHASELRRGQTGIRVYNGTAEFRSFIVYR